MSSFNNPVAGPYTAYCVERVTTPHSMEGFFSSAFGRIGDAFRGLYQNITNMSTLDKISSDSSRFLSVVGKVPYADLTSFNFDVPEGMGSDYLTFSSRVLEGSMLIEELDTQVLKPFKTLLSQMINGAHVADHISSVTQRPLQKAINDKVAQYQKCRDSIQSLYTKKATSTAPYTQVIRRHEDWVEVFKNITKIINLNEAQRTYLVKEVKSLSVLIDEIVELIKEDKMTGASPKVISSFAEMVYGVSEAVTFTAQMYYYTESMVHQINPAMKRAIKALG